MDIEAAIAEDLAKPRRCFPHGKTPLGSIDFVRPRHVAGEEVVLIDIDVGHRGYRVSISDYMEMRKRPYRHIGIWQFVSEDDEAADDVAWAVSNPESVGRQLHDLKKKYNFSCAALRSSSDPPADCDWPFCGCDPYADKVLAAIEESGCTIVRQPQTE